MGQYDDNVWKSKGTCPINPDKPSRDSTNRLNMEVSKATYKQKFDTKEVRWVIEWNGHGGMALRWTHNGHGMARICRKLTQNPEIFIFQRGAKKFL